MKRGRRRLARRVAMACVVMPAGLFIAWLLVLGLGISIPLDGFRKTIETAVSRASGREVHIDGKLLLRPSIGPTIVAHDVHIASLTGQGDLLRAGRVAVRLAPAALLRGEPRSTRLLIEDASISLEKADAGGYARLLSASAELLAQQPELHEVTLQRAELNLRDDISGQTYQLKPDELSVHTRSGQALELILRGRFQQHPYTIELTGGQLADLLTPSGPWPLRVRLNFADTRLLLDGSLEARRQGFVIDFELGTDWPAEFPRLAARFGQLQLAGQLSLRVDQGRPLVTGELQLPALDAVLQYGGGAGVARDAADRSSPRGEKLSGGPVSVPLSASIAGVPFHGQLIFAGPGEEPAIELALSATDANARKLLAMLTGTTGIRGRFQHIGFRASVLGGGEAGIVNRVALALQVDGARLSYGNATGEQPVDVSLDELVLTLPAGAEVLVRAQGALLDEPFSVGLTAGGLKALLVDESWPITLTATGGGAVLDINGSLAAFNTNTAARLHVAVYGKRLGDLAAWLGVLPCAAAPYTLRGQLVLAEDIGRLQFLQLQTGRTRLNGELDWSGYDQTALLQAVFHFEELDPADIEVLIPLVKQGSDEAAKRGIAIDMPFLPRRVEITNADFDLTIAHILLKLVEITEVSLFVPIREGWLQRSPIHAQLGNASFQGYLDPASEGTSLVFENEDADSAAGGRMDKLFSSAVRWAGNTAIVPLSWIFRKKFSALDSADCQLQDDNASH